MPFKTVKQNCTLNRVSLWAFETPTDVPVGSLVAENVEVGLPQYYTVIHCNRIGPWYAPKGYVVTCRESSPQEITSWRNAQIEKAYG